MILHAIRHAPTAAANGPIGRLDVPILGAHEDVATAVLQALPDAPRVVWSSPLARCAGTARLVAERLAVVHRVDERLLEISYGDWEGRSWDQLLRDQPEAYTRWLDAWATRGPPAGESAADVERRVAAWLADLDDAVHLLVGHAGVIRALHVCCRGLGWADAMATPVAHAGLPAAMAEFHVVRHPRT